MSAVILHFPVKLPPNVIRLDGYCRTPCMSALEHGKRLCESCPQQRPRPPGGVA